MLQSLTDGVLHHLDLHRLHVTDVNSLSAVDQLAELAAKTTVTEPLTSDAFKTFSNVCDPE